MKNFFTFLSLKNIKETTRTLWDRFPLAIVLVTLNTGFILYQIHIEEASNLVMQTILSLVVTFFLATGVSLYSESQKTSSIW